jgi:uncharacterized protein (DUF433 family)
MLAVPRAAAARLAGVSVRRVDYWASTGLVGPSDDRTLGPGRRVRLYEFVDLLALMVAAELRAWGVSLQHVRQIVAHVLERGYDQPLTQLRFAIVGSQVYFQHEDGEWEGGIHPDQLVLHQVLDLDVIRRKIAEGIERADDEIGRVERRRGVQGGRPVFAGTRVPVDTVRRHLAAGRPVAEVLEAFPVLSRPISRRSGTIRSPELCASSVTTTLMLGSQPSCADSGMMRGPAPGRAQPGRGRRPHRSRYEA